MRKLVLTSLISIFLCSCTHYYYVPNVHNVPLFRERNEYRASAAIGKGNESNCLELQTAYSITENIAAMINFMSVEGDYIEQNRRADGKYFDGAIGYYKPFEEHGVFEIYGGVGFSNQHHQYGAIGTADLSFIKLFLQPAVGLTFKGFDAALSTRICKLDFTGINSKIAVPFGVLDTISKYSTSYLFEPAITIRGGWKYVKVQLQLSASKNFTNPNLPFENLHFGIGVFIAITKRY